MKKIQYTSESEIKSVAIYTDFERCIGYFENKFDREVGEYTKTQDGQVMVYCLIHLDKFQYEIMRQVWETSRLYGKTFFDKLNNLVESIIAATASSDACKKILEKQAEIEKKAQEERDLRACAFAESLLSRLNF